MPKKNRPISNYTLVLDFERTDHYCYPLSLGHHVHRFRIPSNRTILIILRWIGEKIIQRIAKSHPDPDCRTCDHCNGDVYITDSFCSHCGQRLHFLGKTKKSQQLGQDTGQAN
jgi:hypothetical protein